MKNWVVRCDRRYEVAALRRPLAIIALLFIALSPPAYAQISQGGGGSSLPPASGSGQCLTSVGSGSAAATWGSCGSGNLPALGNAGFALFQNADGTVAVWSACGGDLTCSTVTPGLYTVTKIRGNAVKAGAPTDAQLYVWNSTNSDLEPVSLSGDLTITNAGVATVSQVNGATIPASTSLLASNSSHQVIAATLPIPVASGGTNATSAGATAANNIGAAAEGANTDITSLGGLTTAITVAQGGTNHTSASAGAAHAIGAAAEGANTDITSLGGLTTPLSVGQGGIGTNAAGPTAAANIGALAKANNLSDLTSALAARNALGLSALATQTPPITVAQGGMPAPGTSGNLAFDNGTTYVSVAPSGDFCENSLATFTLCAIQGIPISGTVNSGVAGQILSTDGAGNFAPFQTYWQPSIFVQTPATSTAYAIAIPAIKFNANFASSTGIPASSVSCSSAPTAGRDFTVNCIVSGTLTHVGDVTVSTSCTTTGDSGVTYTTVSGLAQTCSAGRFEIDAPSTVDGSGYAFSFVGHQ